MPHSHSDKGVIRSGVSFLRLTKPVYFPGKEDQPIYLLIAVAARDNTAHLDLMGNVAAMISDDSSLAKVMSCSSVEEIYTMMNKAEDTGWMSFTVMTLCSGRVMQNIKQRLF